MKYVVGAFLVMIAVSAAADTLATAKRMGSGKFKGKTYSEINCVQFVQAVLEEEMGRALTKAEAEAVAMRRIDKNQLSSLVAKGDPSTRGVQAALVGMKKGRAIPLSEARPGDFVQFWKKNKEGDWEGHAALIERMEGNLASLFGSHESLGGIGTAGYKLALKEAEDRRIYIGRFEP